MTQLPSLNEAEAAVLRAIRDAPYATVSNVYLRNIAGLLGTFQTCTNLAIRALLTSEYSARSNTKMWRMNDAGRAALAQWEEENQK